MSKLAFSSSSSKKNLLFVRFEFYCTIDIYKDRPNNRIYIVSIKVVHWNLFIKLTENVQIIRYI